MSLWESESGYEASQGEEFVSDLKGFGPSLSTSQKVTVVEASDSGKRES